MQGGKRTGHGSLLSGTELAAENIREHNIKMVRKAGSRCNLAQYFVIFFDCCQMPDHVLQSVNAVKFAGALLGVLSILNFSTSAQGMALKTLLGTPCKYWV